jgi:nitrate/TMAO reductase-like tetraheme cytochrome c subunit
MFKRKPKQTAAADAPLKTGSGQPRWFKISIYANVAVVVIAVLAAAGGYVVHLSNTSPAFCGTCHIMQANVTSYLTSSNLDHVHAQAGVQCKDCHDYPLKAEISSGVKFIIGDYTVDKTDALQKRKFDDSLCLKCHISTQHVAQLTDFLAKNPHDSHFGAMPCNTCHVSHGQQIDYCAGCHDNGGQRLIGVPITPRGTINGSASGSAEPTQAAPANPPTSGG